MHTIKKLSWSKKKVYLKHKGKELDTENILPRYKKGRHSPVYQLNEANSTSC